MLNLVTIPNMNFEKTICRDYARVFLARGRMKRTWMEVVRIVLYKCNLSEDLVQDRTEWRNRIYLADLNTVGKGFDDSRICYTCTLGVLMQYELPVYFICLTWLR